MSFDQSREKKKEAQPVRKKSEPPPRVGFFTNVDQFFGGFFTTETKAPELLAPWEDDSKTKIFLKNSVPSQWIGRETEFEKYIKSISKNELFFKFQPPTSFRIPLEKLKAQQIAKLALEKDNNLKELRMKIVPTK
jgi:hypothetical protein